MTDCPICEEIELIKEGRHPYFVTELATGFVILGNRQYYKGYTLFLCKSHVSELHYLSDAFRQRFLEEMVSVAKAVFCTFRPVKLNYELLGNRHYHLRWHIFPRHKDDPKLKHPVWRMNPHVMNARRYIPTIRMLNKLKRVLKEKIEQQIYRVIASPAVSGLSL